ncbi:hypothetical protein [Clostridium botulinum]|uniref:hypothetical protein n=1 Tax=Clostridium botulinum TaxID=1491 RepID=UPI000366E3AB|nr:hypothetical protein [Clostridium botulinum]
MRIDFLKAEQDEITKDWRVDLNIGSKESEQEMLDFITSKFMEEGVYCNSFGDGMDKTVDTYVTVIGLERCEITETRKELTELYKQFKKEFKELKVVKVEVAKVEEKATEKQETPSNDKKSKSVKVLCIATGVIEVFPSQSSFFKFLKDETGAASTDQVRNLVRGTRQEYKGYVLAH